MGLLQKRKMAEDKIGLEPKGFWEERQATKSYPQRLRKIAEKYQNGINTLTFQQTPDYVTTHPHMLFFAFSENQEQRDKNLKFLRDSGIDARLPYMPINIQPCNPELEIFNSPNANDIFERSFTLPIYNNMTTDECDFVIDFCNKL